VGFRVGPARFNFSKASEKRILDDEQDIQPVGFDPVSDDVPPPVRKGWLACLGWLSFGAAPTATQEARRCAALDYYFPLSDLDQGEAFFARSVSGSAVADEIARQTVLCLRPETAHPKPALEAEEKDLNRGRRPAMSTDGVRALADAF